MVVVTNLIEWNEKFDDLGIEHETVWRVMSLKHMMYQDFQGKLMLAAEVIGRSL